MATYFSADHVVWAYQIGLIADKKTGERAQKVSLWSWALGSVLTMIIEANAILSVSPAACAAAFTPSPVLCKRTCLQQPDPYMSRCDNCAQMRDLTGFAPVAWA